MNSTATAKEYLLEWYNPRKHSYEDIICNINQLHIVGLITADQCTELQKWAYLNFCK